MVVPTNSIINATESAQITANAQAGKRDNDIFVTVYEDNYLSIRIGFDGYTKAASGYSYASSILVQTILKTTHPDYNPNFTTVNPNTKGVTANLYNGLTSNTVNETTYYYTIDTLNQFRFLIRFRRQNRYLVLSQRPSRSQYHSRFLTQCQNQYMNLYLNRFRVS